MVSKQRLCQNKYTCEIWKPYHLPIESYDYGSNFWKEVKLQGQRSEGQSHGIQWIRVITIEHPP
jgi:hypothetical protein